MYKQNIWLFPQIPQLNIFVKGTKFFCYYKKIIFSVGTSGSYYLIILIFTNTLRDMFDMNNDNFMNICELSKFYVIYLKKLF